MSGPFLLDSNALIALVVTDHEHHARAITWAGTAGTLATCPIVEGALVRFLVRLGEHHSTATRLLAALHDSRRCELWPDSLGYADVDLAHVIGHRQVADAYLVALAAAHGGRLATLDRALAATHGEGALLIP